MSSTLENIENICFCCLAEDEILRDLLANGPDISLVECYKTCAGVDLNMDRPKRICSTCERKLKSFFEFREMCRASYKLLTENSTPIVVVKHENSVVDATRCLSGKRTKVTVVQEFAEPSSNVDASDKEAGFFTVYMGRRTCLDHSCSADLEAESSANVECVRCFEKFPSDDDLFCHQFVCQEFEDLHTCEVCGKIFDTKVKLQKHVRIVHVGRIKRVCAVCGHGSKSNTAFELHMASHKAESSFKCSRPGCQSAFKHQNLLKNHMRQHEIKDGLRPKPFECHHCKKTFAQYVGIKRHMGTHFDSPLLRPFMCPMCEKRLQTKNDLEVHLVTHSNVKNFQCCVCPRLFTSQTAANRHYQSCHVNNYYQCTFCDDKQFKTTTMLRSHLFFHRGFSPYNCPACSTKYTQLNLFKRHLRNVHEIEFDEKLHGYVEQERDYIDRLIRQCKRKDDSQVLMPQPQQKKRRKADSTD